MDNLTVIAIVLLIVIVYCCITRSNFGATPPPTTVDLSKIKASWNPGTPLIKGGVLEYKPGNSGNDSDLEIPFNLLDRNYYKVSISIGSLTGNKSPITIKPLNSSVYNDNLSSTVTNTFTAQSDKTISFNIMSTKTANLYIKVATANKTDLLKIKSITIQKVSPAVTPKVTPAVTPKVTPVKAAPPPPVKKGPAPAPSPSPARALVVDEKILLNASIASATLKTTIKDNSAAVAKANNLIQKGTAYLTKFKNVIDAATKKRVEDLIKNAQSMASANSKVQIANSAVLNDINKKYLDPKK